MAVDTVAAADESVPPQSVVTRRRPSAGWLAGHRFGLLAIACYTVLGLWVYARLWIDPAHRLVGDGQDHQLFIWMLGHAARSVTHLENPLFSSQLNVPDGVNLIANTSVLGLGIPLVPVTLVFGPGVSFALLGLISLAGTAAAWYYVFSRRLVASKPAAAVAGGLCGFAPGLIAHSPGHLHVIAQFVLPFIVLYTFKLAEPGRSLCNGLVLGLLITYQVFISEEMLLLAALAAGTLVVVYGLLRRDRVRELFGPFVRGAAVAAGVSGVLLAYPLWFQFLGPQHSRGLPFDTHVFVTDALAYVMNPGQSVAGDQVAAVKLASNFGEENAFFGFPLMVVAAAIVVWLWRDTMVRVLAVTAAVFGALSLGTEVVIGSHHTGIPGPFRLVAKLPVFDMALPTRFSLIIAPILAALLALAGDRILARGILARGTDRAAGSGDARGLPVRLLAVVTAAVVLVPIAPVPLRGFEPPPVPAFITAGTWRSYVPEGRTVVPVPLPRNDAMAGMLWAAQTNTDMAIPRGFFIGPDGTAKRKGVFDPPARPTANLLRAVATAGKVPSISDRDRANAITDLRYWRAAILVLITPTAHADALHATLDALVGPGQLIDGAWIWDVRTMVSGKA
jgi:hypothetical protein